MRDYPPKEKQTTTPKLVPITSALIKHMPSAMHVYRIAPADVLDIAVWQHPELSLPEKNSGGSENLPSRHGAAGREGYLVNANGDIYFPLVKNIHVYGKTVDQIRTEIAARLRRYIKNPEVTVRVADFRSRKVYVLGEVKNPRIIPVNDQPLSITDAILMAGGMDTSAADPEHVYVIRGRPDQPDVFWLNARTPDALLLAEQFRLKPGDVLFVSSAPAARWNRIINQLLPTIQTIWYTKAIIDTGS